MSIILAYVSSLALAMTGLAPAMTPAAEVALINQLTADAVVPVLVDAEPEPVVREEERPAPEPEPEPEPARDEEPEPPTSEQEPSAPTTSVWDRLAECEANGEWGYGPHSGWGSGMYHGGLQFHPGTWDSYRPAEYPTYAYQASREQQIAVAEKVLASQGWGAWPACSKKLGLR